MPEISAGIPRKFAVLIKEKTAELIRGETDMLDAIQISFALWGMIFCASIKAAHLVHVVF